MIIITGSTNINNVKAKSFHLLTVCNYKIYSVTSLIYPDLIKELNYFSIFLINKTSQDSSSEITLTPLVQWSITKE